MKNTKVLIIEDDDAVRENITTLLNEEGYQVLSAANGELGIEKAREAIPELIICDILMPGLDGYDVLDELSKHKETRLIPFIYLTAKVEREDIRKGMQLGADDYLFKPFKAEELLNAIKARLRKRLVLKAESVPNKSKKKTKAKFGIDDKMFITINGHPNIIRVNEIVCIMAENQYSSLKLCDERSILLRRSISSWEKMLPSKYFLRIHRSTIINTEYINKMEKWYNSSFLIYLKNLKEPFTISKRYSSKIRKNQI
jgi:DNA-binding response OmpR family regulator